MNENLSQLVKETPGIDPVVFSEEELDLPTDVEETEELSADDNENDGYVVQISSLTDWFDANVENFPNIRKPTVSIQGVDPAEQLIVTVQVIDEEATEEGDKRKLVVFDDSHLVPVLDLPAMDMQVYNNGFRIIYDFGQGIFIKSYGIRTGLISVFCNDINDKLIPYAIIKTKKSDTDVEVPRRDINEVGQKLIQPLDLEALQLRYKQSSKAEELTTNQQAVDWLIERQSSIADINHHLQIDNVIIETLT